MAIQNFIKYKLNYIPGPDGLCAIYVKNSNPNSDTLYYIFKDHIGSISTISDKNGNVLQRINYNLWGKRSIAGGANTGFLFDRGFTGHEHLDVFGLINMNGRVYDPLLGRFLSPDNYVQGSGSQAFNRYTYCRNNPLKYIDPSGYMFGWYSGTTQLDEWWENYWARINIGTGSYNSGDGPLPDPSGHRHSLFDEFTEQNMSEIFGSPEYVTIHGSEYSDYWDTYRTENETSPVQQPATTNPGGENTSSEGTVLSAAPPLSKDLNKMGFVYGFRAIDMVTGIIPGYNFDRVYFNAVDLVKGGRQFTKSQITENGITLDILNINRSVRLEEHGEEMYFGKRGYSPDPNREYFIYGEYRNEIYYWKWGSYSIVGSDGSKLTWIR